MVSLIKPAVKTDDNARRVHDYLDTGHIYLTVDDVVEADAADGAASRNKSIGIKSFVFSGRPENGLGGRFGGSVMSCSAALGVN
jgi:hypothetical protein